MSTALLHCVFAQEKEMAAGKSQVKGKGEENRFLIRKQQKRKNVIIKEEADK